MITGKMNSLAELYATRALAAAREFHGDLVTARTDSDSHIERELISRQMISEQNEIRRLIEVIRHERAVVVA
jgi:hypothetical protein